MAEFEEQEQIYLYGLDPSGNWIPVLVDATGIIQTA